MGKVCPHGWPAVCTHTCQGLPLMLAWKGAQSRPPHEAGAAEDEEPSQGPLFPASLSPLQSTDWVIYGIWWRFLNALQPYVSSRRARDRSP